MPLLDSKRQRAALLIMLLGAALMISLWPFTTGLIGAPVLYVIFAPLHRLLARWLHTGIAAGVVILVALLLLLGPGVSFITLLATEAQQMAGGVIQSPLLSRLAELRIGPYDVGDQLVQLGERMASWIGSSALGLIGTATRLTIQLTIACFGLYYLLTGPQTIWQEVRPFIPFSAENTEALRQRFRDVTISTLVGTFATALVQGVLVGIGFAVTGLSNAVFWGAVTMIMAILPVVGSGLVWAPGVAALALEGRYGAAIGLAVYSLVIVSNVDNVIRPWVFRRYAQLHPFITVIGAFAGIQYFGLLGLLIGPLAISYFFELIRMYRQEYLAERRVMPASAAGGVPAR